MASTIKLNYDNKALATVVNYECKRDATIWSVPYGSKIFKVKAKGGRLQGILLKGEVSLYH
jgi:hypothetical protein